MNSRPKIVIASGIFPPDIGGPASYAVTLGKSLSDQADVTVVTYSDPRKKKDDEQYSFHVVRVWRAIPKGIRHIMYVAKLWSHARGAIAILSLNAVSAGYPALLVAKVAKVRLIVRIVGDASWEWAAASGKTYLMIDDFQERPRKGRAGRLHRIQKKVCKAADGIIVPSEYLSDLVMAWGIDEKKISVVYNGSDFEPSNMDKEDARKEIGVAGNIILSSGRLVPWKGFRMLIKLMPQLFQVNQFLRLVIVGEGPQMNELKTMVRTLGLERKVFLVGKKTARELAVYLAAADMFVLNTGYEGFSHLLLEALRACTPVITTSVGGNPELIEQGESGFLVKFNDEFNLLEAIKAIHRDKSIATNFCEKGKKRSEEFTVDRMLRETVEVILQ